MKPDWSAALIAELRKDGRKPLTQLSRQTGVPVTTIWDWMRRNKGKGLRRFTALPDYAALGYPSRAFITLKCDKDKKPELGACLKNSPLVNNLWHINNGYDYLLDVICHSMSELEDFTASADARPMMS